MAIDFQKYHKNIDRIKKLILASLENQLEKLSPDESDLRYKLLSSFYGVKSKWYSILDIKELNAVLVNLDKVEFEANAGTNQKATAVYNIDFQAAGDSDTESFEAISFVSGIIRETFIKTSKSEFEAISVNIGTLEYSPDKINNGTDNILVARMVLSISTSEELTDFDDFDGARANMTNATANGGTYANFKEW